MNINYEQIEKRKEWAQNLLKNTFGDKLENPNKLYWHKELWEVLSSEINKKITLTYVEHLIIEQSYREGKKKYRTIPFEL